MNENEELFLTQEPEISRSQLEHERRVRHLNNLEKENNKLQEEFYLIQHMIDKEGC